MTLKTKADIGDRIYYIKAGKTTLALSSDPNCLLIDTDNGVDRVSAEHLMTAGFIQVRSYAEVLNGVVRYKKNIL